MNKCDRTGAEPLKVRQQLEDKLGLNAVMAQLPIGLEDKHIGIVDLVKMKAIYFEGDFGDVLREDEIPADLADQAEEHREKLLDAVSMFDEELMEAALEGTATEEQIDTAIRKAVIANELCPVYVGSAYKNKGVQTLLNAVIKYLPSPLDITNTAVDIEKDEAEYITVSDDGKPTVALAFKLEDGQYGQLTYIRVYQGMVKKGSDLYNVRTKKKFKVGRLIRMHANHMEDITEAGSGDIVALFGIDCASGDTFCHPDINVSMTSMYVPNPVISLAIKPKDKAAADRMGKAIGRFVKEDPTFRSHVDEESNETIIQGMGELHLEVYVERMKREYKAEVETGRPQVAYRETISQRAEFNYTHKKQTGGSGQFGRVAGYIEPNDESNYEFVNQIKGGVIPQEYVPSVDKGIQIAMVEGTYIGSPVVGVRALINDGSTHPVDSSDQAFQTAGIGAFRATYDKAKPIALEPIMKVVVEGPTEFQGNIFATLNQRRGVIIASNEDGLFSVVEAEVPLAEMFGFSTVLRSLTQGKAEYSMEFAKYGKVPQSIAEELREKYLKSRQEGNK